MGILNCGHRYGIYKAGPAAAGMVRAGGARPRLEFQLARAGLTGRGGSLQRLQTQA